MRPNRYIKHEVGGIQDLLFDYMPVNTSAVAPSKRLEEVPRIGARLSNFWSTRDVLYMLMVLGFDHPFLGFQKISATHHLVK